MNPRWDDDERDWVAEDPSFTSSPTSTHGAEPTGELDGAFASHGHVVVINVA